MMKRGVDHALRRFGFKQTVRGALIIGVLGGLMMGAYGTAIVKVYPTEKSRQELVQTLGAAPAINFLSGEVKDAGTPASYSIYKSLPMMVLLTSIWGLLVVTRLLRGAEEDGRLELLVSGAVTRRQATTQLLIGFGCSLILAVAVMWVLTAVLGAAPGVGLSIPHALYMTLAVFLPGVVFASVGVFTSQLALTRSKAVLYGLVPLFILYVVRGVANTSDQLDWLKILSPFGWSDLLDSVLDPHVVWIIPSVLVGGVFTALGIYAVSHRDYATSVLRQPTEVKSRFYFLNSSLAFILRQKRWAYFWWLIATVATGVFMTALAGLVSTLVHDSSSLGPLLALPPDKIKILFVGESFMIVSLILLAMMIVELSGVRRDEAKSYLDNLLVRPIRRSRWLRERLCVSLGAAVLITTITTIAIWAVAQTQGVNVNFSDAVNCGLAVANALVLLCGVGVFLYGLWPRIAVVGMTLVVGWAFVIDIVRNLFHLEDWVSKTSIISYIPIDPSKSPEWAGIAWMICIGVVLSVAGIVAFTKRDIMSE